MSCDIPISLEDYIKPYGLHGGLLRLEFIARNANAPELLNARREALRLGLEIVRQSSNVNAYETFHSLHQELLGEAAPVPLDNVWIDATDKASQQLLGAFEQEIGQCKLSQQKENTRLAYVNLAGVHADRGDFSSAVTAAIKARECCDSSNVVPMCFLVIKYAAMNHAFLEISCHAGKAQHTPDKNDSETANVSAAWGLFYMCSAKYAEAATNFFSTKDGHLANVLSDVIAPQDVAVYGILCALATMNRDELRKQMEQLSKNWIKGLTSVPAIWDIVDCFINCKYAQGLEALERIRPSFDLDIYLAKHIGPLCEQIRHSAIIQFFTPFRSLRLSSMAEVFRVTPEVLQKELAELIRKKRLEARIDTHQQVLVDAKRYAFNFPLSVELSASAVVVHSDLILSWCGMKFI